MINFLVTTSYRPTEEQLAKAKQIAEEENLPFIHRNKRSISRLMHEYGCGAVVVGSNGITISVPGFDDPLFFHPNMAMLRVKRWLKYKEDPFIEACNIVEGDVFVDATLGMGSDAILASMITGQNGLVIGIEKSFPIALIVKEGFESYVTPVKEMNEALRRITVVQSSHLTWLKNAQDKSVDIVYFDPMFTEKVKGSHGFDLLRPFTTETVLTEDVITEAKRVARKRIVLKDHFRSKRFEEFGFQVQVRPSATYHFGIMELEGK